MICGGLGLSPSRPTVTVTHHETLNDDFRPRHSDISRTESTQRRLSTVGRTDDAKCGTRCRRGQRRRLELRPRWRRRAAWSRRGAVVRSSRSSLHQRMSGPECTSGPRPMSRNAGPRAETRFAPIRRGMAGGIENGEFPTIRTSIKCSDGPAPTAPRVVFAPSPMSFETKVDHSVQSRGMTMADSGAAAPASRPREHGLSAQTGISFSYGS